MNELSLMDFMRESNNIEDEEDGLNDLEAATKFLATPISRASVFDCHLLLSAHRNVNWGGRYRNCNVGIVEYRPPSYEKIPYLMEDFFYYIGEWDSWDAHNRFQVIHPFQDLNGRVGRLIWLHKAVDEGYDGRIGFLHKYYYQTLSKQK